MCIHCAKVKFIRKDHAVEWSHVHVHGVCIRTADGHHAPSAGKNSSQR